MDFRRWIEGTDEPGPTITFEGPNIPWDVWKDWDESIELFIYGDMLGDDGLRSSDFHTARARGVIRIFDVPSRDGRAALLSIRKTGRIDDAVNGAVVRIPDEQIKELAGKYPGYHMGTIPVLLIDPETGFPLKKKKVAFYLFNPEKVNRKLQPTPEYLSQLMQIAYNISPEFGEEFVKTTFRLPKRGNRLVRITR